ncbi:unnamed protein product, partial [Caretta caretta]
MMSLGVSKGDVIPPSEEDRKKIIRQMKVRTTLKGDKSWIYPQNSDNEEEMKRSSLHLPCRSGKIDGGSPASASVTPHGNRLPGSKPTSGYLIRGVFTRTIEKTSPESTFYSNGTQKSAAAQAKSSSLPRFSSGYKMTTEDYKKLAPFNVRQISVDSDEEKPAFSPDEHKKRTEAANSVLRRTASRERSYVLSAAKKSNGSPTQEVPPFIAKSVEIEEEGGLHMKNQTLPASSSINGVRKRPTGSSWSKPKPMTAVSTTSFDTDSKSQATRSWSESTSQISSYTEISDKVDEEKPVETSPAEATTTKPTLATGKSDKSVKEERDLISWDESVPKATTISTGERLSVIHALAEGAIHLIIQMLMKKMNKSGPRTDPWSTPLAGKNTVGDRIKSFAKVKLTLSVKIEAKKALSTSAFSTPSVTMLPPPFSPAPDLETFPHKPLMTDSQPLDIWVMQNVTLKDTWVLHLVGLSRKSEDKGKSKGHSSRKQIEEVYMLIQVPAMGFSFLTRSVPGYEEGRPTKEVRYESTTATKHKEPELNVTRSSPSSGVSSAVTQEVRHKVPMHLDDEEFDFNSKSSSHSTESNVTTTDPRHGIPVCMEDGELDPERLSPLKGNTEDAENENISTTQSEPPTTRKHTEPDENTAQLPSASSERISMSTACFQYHSPSAMGHKSNPSAASKGILFVKEYVNSRELSPTPHYSSDSLIDLSDIERASYLHSSAFQRSCEGVCTYCGREIRDCPKIMIEHLNVYCHEYCFR